MQARGPAGDPGGRAAGRTNVNACRLSAMSRFEKALLKILRGTSDRNIPFEDLCWLLRRLHFEERIRGSHHIFTRPDVGEILNVQPKQGKAKAYQVKQVRDIILKYRLGDAGDGKP